MTKAMVTNMLALWEELNLSINKTAALRRHRAVALIQAVLYAVSQDHVPRGAISAPINARRAGVSCHCGFLAHLAAGMGGTPTTPRQTGNVSVHRYFMIDV
jgi:hypothetical protein